ncbi:pyridoxamine 5'-phosphate oxidase family protein [Candidatus Leptofilum sp.]|uniref:pyridoxamine 5'-phosphate oxidase family protein n=1 Tax=Candidatus Leptofilum sp. TaxID=3241576 RepID=UPI003B594BDD
MTLSDAQIAFIKDNPSAAMITTAKDGTPKAVRISVGIIDGKLWSSGTQDRIRTKRLRRDPRCTLFIFDNQYKFLTLETAVTILDGSDAPEQNLRLMRQLQNRPTGPLNWFGHELDTEAFLQTMVEQQRLVYEFDVTHSYGMVQ